MLSDECAFALRTCRVVLFGDLAVQFSVSQVDLLDFPDEIIIAVAMLLFQDCPQSFRDHKELFNVACDGLTLRSDLCRSPGGPFPRQLGTIRPSHLAGSTAYE